MRCSLWRRQCPISRLLDLCFSRTATVLLTLHYSMVDFQPIAATLCRLHYDAKGHTRWCLKEIFPVSTRLRQVGEHCPGVCTDSRNPPRLPSLAITIRSLQTCSPPARQAAHGIVPCCPLERSRWCRTPPAGETSLQPLQQEHIALVVPPDTMALVHKGDVQPARGIEDR